MATEILKTVTISAEVNMKVVLNNNAIFMPHIKRKNTIILIENIYDASSLACTPPNAHSMRRTRLRVSCQDKMQYFLRKTAG